MKYSTFDLMRLWALLTGVVLATVYFTRVWDGVPGSPLLAMLIAGIGGFELFLFAQDRLTARRGGR